MTDRPLGEGSASWTIAHGRIGRRDDAQMTTLRPFTCDDLFVYNDVNTDCFTETFNLNFYLGYLATWPEYFSTAEGPAGQIAGYVMGKVEGRGENWHGHVTAVTVAPSYRRQGLAKKLMGELEGISEKMHNGYFVDLFVRKSNSNAITMYEGLGYTVYRTVLNYYMVRTVGSATCWPNHSPRTPPRTIFRCRSSFRRHSTQRAASALQQPTETCCTKTESLACDDVVRCHVRATTVLTGARPSITTRGFSARAHGTVPTSRGKRMRTTCERRCPEMFPRNP